jgi:hypothetical protein
MENKPNHSPPPKTRPPTLTGTFFFTVLHLIFLSLLAWFLLEVWFSVWMLLGRGEESHHTIQSMLYDYRGALPPDDSVALDRLLTIFERLKTLVPPPLAEYLGDTCMAVLWGVSEIILARGFLFLKFMPFMLVILSVFIMDGLVLRDKRKFQGARESTFLFHRLKELAKVSFFFLFFLYMVFPYRISPSVFLLPLALVSSLCVMLSIKNFKKYV